MTLQPRVFLSDSERKVMGALGVKLAETAEYKAVDEKLTAYRAVTSPSEKLYVTYSLSNFDGTSMRPSEIVNNIVTAFRQYLSLIRHFRSRCIP